MKYKSGTMAMVNHTFTSEQLNDKLFYEYNKIRVIEPLITSAINSVADNLETEFSGLEYSVKTAPSVEDKLLRAEKRDTSGRFSPKRELANFKDMIRYTEICNHRDIASVTKDTIEFMKEQGYTLSGTKNYYTHPFGATGYKGIHLNFISPYGQEIELQVHSKESFDAKQKGHELYEKIRAVSTLKRDKEAMKEEIKRIHGIVKNPPNIEAIHDYKMAFKDSGLEKVELNEGLKLIGEAAFAYCKIKALRIPASVYDVDYMAFAGVDYVVFENENMTTSAAFALITEQISTVHVTAGNESIYIMSPTMKECLDGSVRTMDDMKRFAEEKAITMAEFLIKKDDSNGFKKMLEINDYCYDTLKSILDNIQIDNAVCMAYLMDKIEKKREAEDEFSM